MRELSRPVVRGSRGVNAKARAREHDLQLGRFLPIDPVGYADQMKRYVLIHHDPVSLVDQSGTQAHDRRTAVFRRSAIHAARPSVVQSVSMDDVARWENNLLV